MFSKIKTTLALNKNPINIEGKAFYYSKFGLWFHLSLYILFLALCFFLIFEMEPVMLFFMFIALCILFYETVKIILPALLYIHPILIIKNGLVYHTKNKIWYDLNNCYTSTSSVGMSNYAGTLKIIPKDKSIDVCENLWYIENADTLEKVMKKILGITNFYDYEFEQIKKAKEQKSTLKK